MLVSTNLFSKIAIRQNDGLCSWYMLFLSNNLCEVWWREGCTNLGEGVHFETIFKQMCYFLYFLWLFFVHYRIKFRKFAACIFGCRGFLLK